MKRIDNTINVLHIVSSLGRGGRERQLSVLNHYKIDGVKQFVISFYDTDNSYTNEYDFQNLIYLSKNKLKRFLEVYQFSKKNKINLIYTWGNNEYLYTLPIAALLKIKLINGSIRHGIRKNSFNHRFRSFILQNSKYIIGNSQAGFKANKINFDSRRHFVMYNGIEDKFFIEEDVIKRKVYFKNNNGDEDSIMFISIANFIPYKDYITILEALNILKKEGIKFHYIMIGKGKMEGLIRNKLKELGLEKNAKIYNDGPNIPELLSISQIMIHSSLGEGCSNAILEAKAAGLKVVASNTGGTSEILGEEDFLFQYKNADDLKTKLKNAIDSLRKSSTSRKEIQSKTKERFSVNKMQENYYQIIKSILNN